MAKSNPLDEAKDLQQMLVSYAKQETVEPLKTLGKYLGFGIAGSFTVFLGLFFLSLGFLRAFQSIDTFSGVGKGSLVPYLITLIIMAIVIGLLVATLSKARRKVEERPFT